MTAKGHAVGDAEIEPIQSRMCPRTFLREPRARAEQRSGCSSGWSIPASTSAADAYTPHYMEANGANGAHGQLGGP